MRLLLPIAASILHLAALLVLIIGAMAFPQAALAQYRLCVNQQTVPSPAVPIAEALKMVTGGQCPAGMTEASTPDWWKSIAKAEQARGLPRGQGQAQIEKQGPISTPGHTTGWATSCTPSHPVTEEIDCSIAAKFVHDAGSATLTFSTVRYGGRWLDLPMEFSREGFDPQPERSLSARVDQSRPILNFRNSLAVREKLVAEMLKGRALLIQSTFPTERTFEFDLSNFQEAYRQLQTMIKSAQ